MKGFAGFPDGKIRITPVPNRFFSDLLPHIDHQGELKVTLYCFWRLALKEGQIRYLSRDEFLNDDALIGGLATHREEAENLLNESLERACSGRAAVKGIQLGKWHPSTNSEVPISVQIERPNIFILYEQNIGPLTPLIADELRDAEEAYPSHWVNDAFRLAVQNNARSWRYVLAILERWQVEGRDDSGKGRGNTEKSRRRYLDYLK